MTTVESQLATLGIDDSGGSPYTFITVGNIVSMNGLRGGQATVIDVTNLASTRKEKVMGLPDEGQITCQLQYDPDDTGQIEAEAARAARTLKDFRVTLSDGTTFTFSGYVLTFGLDIGVDTVVTGSITIEITGAVTKAT
jgi:hypothetical protein